MLNPHLLPTTHYNVSSAPCHKRSYLQEAVKSLAPGPQLAGWGHGVNCVLRSSLIPGPRTPPLPQWGVQGPAYKLWRMQVHPL